MAYLGDLRGIAMLIERYWGIFGQSIKREEVRSSKWPILNTQACLHVAIEPHLGRIERHKWWGNAINNMYIPSDLFCFQQIEMPSDTWTALNLLHSDWIMHPMWFIQRYPFGSWQVWHACTPHEFESVMKDENEGRIYVFVTSTTITVVSSHPILPISLALSVLLRIACRLRTRFSIAFCASSGSKWCGSSRSHAPFDASTK